MTTSNAPHTKTKRTYHIERHTLPNDDNQVKAMKQDVQARELSMQAIADKYGVTRKTVYTLTLCSHGGTIQRPCG
jgi:predicted DNA-binding protein YlxM (UPF0122 family)